MTHYSFLMDTAVWFPKKIPVCPLCGAGVRYEGLNSIECSGPDCENFKPGLGVEIDTDYLYLTQDEAIHHVNQSKVEFRWTDLGQNWMFVCASGFGSVSDLLATVNLNGFGSATLEFRAKVL